ncbi:MAG: hypothetical protein WC325_12575 [Candidatus Bathyarchaeia archaeon]|jgi:hypothetical protein
MATNFRDELIEALEGHGKTIFDIKWAGNEDFKIPLEFILKNADFEYSGCFEVDMSLLIVGDDWWLERETDFKQSCWAFKTLPPEPKCFAKCDGRFHVYIER